jgi:hypothetical protein
MLVRSDGRVDRLQPTAMVLGVMADAVVVVRQVEIKLADRLLLFTDGSSEAFNKRDGRSWPETGFEAIRSVNSPPLAEREFLLLTRCLEDRERSALRICHHSHAANIFNLHRRQVEFRTKALRLCGYHIAIGDQQINLPVRWRPGIAKCWRE